jgi:hypothetical protein
MTTGVGTPIAVFSLGLGPLIGAGIQGVSAAIPAVTAGVEAATAAVPAITAGVEAATAVAPAIAAGVEGVAAAAPAIAAGVEGAAAAVPSLMAGVEAGATAAPALAEAAGVGGQSLVQGVAQGAPVVTESLTGALPGAQQAVATPASIMSQISGPQMSTRPHRYRWKRHGARICRPARDRRPCLRQRCQPTPRLLGGEITSGCSVEERR